MVIPGHGRLSDETEVANYRDMVTIVRDRVAALIDVQGGVLVQPGVQWKPRGNITVNAFYNYLDSDVWGNNPNKSFRH